jgi:glycosyltransferase involved in cell wall biosynthesis
MVAEHAATDGGTGAHVARSAATLTQAGYDVTLAVARREGASGIGADLRVIEGLGAFPWSKSTSDELLDVVRGIRPDVIRLQQIGNRDAICTLREQAPVAYDVHSYVGCTSGEFHFRRPGDECERAHGPMCLAHLAVSGCAHTWNPRAFATRYRLTGDVLAGIREANIAICHSEYVRRHLQRNEIHGPKLIPLFADEVADPVPAPAEGPVLFVGRVSAAKGLATLLKALPDGAELNVYGDGWWLPHARKIVDARGIADQVHFRGWADQAQLDRAYGEARVVVVPSHWPEPFGMVGIEAMAHARPVIGAATGGIPEWLTHGETGLLVPPGDVDALRTALTRLLADPDEGARMGEEGARQVRRRFSHEAYRTATRRAYSSAIAGWRGQTRHQTQSTPVPAIA